MSNTALKNVTALLPDGTTRQTNLFIEGDKIAGIGDMPPDYAGQVIDCKDKFAVPGFVNAHTHAAMALLKSYADDMNLMDWLHNKIWPIEAKMNKKDIYWGTMLAIAEMIKSGTTAFADMYADMEQVAEAVVETGVRGILERGIIGVAPNGRQALAENIALFNEYHNAGNGRITVTFGPHAPYTCPPDFLRLVAEEAKKVGAEIHIHLAETIGEVQSCIKEYGKSPIALMEETGILELGVLAAHCVHVTHEDIALMKKYNVRVAHNPGSNMKLASGVAPAVKMLDAGLCVALGTDGASSNNNLDMLEEIRLAALLHKVDGLDPLAVPALTAVKMATEYGAEAVGLKHAIGKLEAGYKADITLFNMNSLNWTPRHDLVSLLAYSANSRDVDTVFVNGKILLENGMLTTIDEERVLREANARAMKLTQKM